MRFFRNWLALLALLAAWPAHAVTVLAGHPVLFALAQDLAGEKITVVRAAPENIPPTRLNAYLTTRGEAAFKAAAQSTDAVLTLRSVWPEDPLYPLARRSNIRVVEIDAANPVDGALPGIALHADKAATVSYPWLDPVSLGRMADILGNELGRLAPEAKPAIAGKLAAFKRRLITLSTRNEMALTKAANVSVASLSPKFDYLVSGLNLDPVMVDVEHLAKSLDEVKPTLLLVDGEPEESVVQVARAAGVRVLALSATGRDPVAELEQLSRAVVEALSH